MRFGTVPFVARLTAAAPPPPPPGGLSIVQSPAKVATDFGTTHTDTLASPVTNGNAIVAVTRGATGDGAPTTVLDDTTAALSLVLSVEVNGGTTWRVYARMNVTDAPESVTATYAGGNATEIAVLEIAGGGSSLFAVGANGTASQSTSTTWNFPFTSAIDGELVFGFMSLNSGGSTGTGTSPFESAVKNMGALFEQLAVGIFPAGSNTGVVTLAPDGRNGGLGWVALRPGA